MLLFNEMSALKKNSSAYDCLWIIITREEIKPPAPSSVNGTNLRFSSTCLCWAHIYSVTMFCSFYPGASPRLTPSPFTQQLSSQLRPSSILPPDPKVPILEANSVDASLTCSHSSSSAPVFLKSSPPCLEYPRSVCTWTLAASPSAWREPSPTLPELVPLVPLYSCSCCFKCPSV